MSRYSKVKAERELQKGRVLLFLVDVASLTSLPQSHFHIGLMPRALSCHHHHHHSSTTKSKQECLNFITLRSRDKIQSIFPPP